MPDIYMDVDTALTEVPVNIFPLTDDTDFKSIEGAVAYNAAGMTLFWHFVTSAGAYTLTAVTPTTAGNYDWTDQGAAGIYTIEIPASGGASINNDTEGYGWFTGVATGVLPWRGPVIGFRAAAINDSMCDTNTTGILAPTTAGRTLDVSAGGEAGVDWANVGTPGSTVGLSATTVATVTTTTTATNVTTVNGLASAVITATSIAADAIGASELAADAVTEIANAVWDMDATGHQTTGTFGQAIGDPTSNATTLYQSIVTDATGTHVAADIIAMKVDTAAILVDTGTTLDGRIPAALVGGRMDADIGAISTDSTAADNLEQAFDDTAGAASWTGIIDQGTAQSATSTTLVLRAAAAFANDELIGATIHIISATAGAGQTRVITDYVLSTDTATVDTWATTPTGTIVYKIRATASGPTALPTPVNVTQWLGTAAATPTVAGVPEVDVTHWLGTAAATPSVAGVPEVDVTYISADDAAANNLEAMFDGTGYAGGSTKLDVNAAQISASATAADNAQLFFDGTGYAAANSTVGTVTTLTGKTGFSLDSAEHTNIADATLKRDMSVVTGEAARSPLNALRFLRNKWTVSGTTLTVTKEDDATSAWTSTVTATPSADPITGNDPA